MSTFGEALGYGIVIGMALATFLVCVWGAASGWIDAVLIYVVSIGMTFIFCIGVLLASGWAP